MTADHLKQLLENGVTLVFAKILNASHNVRGSCNLTTAVTFFAIFIS